MISFLLQNTEENILKNNGNRKPYRLGFVAKSMGNNSFWLSTLFEKYSYVFSKKKKKVSFETTSG